MRTSSRSRGFSPAGIGACRGGGPCPQPCADTETDVKRKKAKSKSRSNAQTKRPAGPTSLSFGIFSFLPFPFSFLLFTFPFNSRRQSTLKQQLLRLVYWNSDNAGVLVHPTVALQLLAPALAQLLHLLQRVLLLQVRRLFLVDLLFAIWRKLKSRLWREFCSFGGER